MLEPTYLGDPRNDKEPDREYAVEHFSEFMRIFDKWAWMFDYSDVEYNNSSVTAWIGPDKNNCYEIDSDANITPVVNGVRVDVLSIKREDLDNLELDIEDFHDSHKS